MSTIYRTFFLFLIMVSPFILQAQSERLVVSKTAQCFLNKRNNQFLVFDDSVSYYSISANGKKWAKHHFTFLSSDLNFEEFKNRFKPITFNNGRIVFVYGGVGEVYELINDTLQRIDHSFKHENQFGHALFEYQNRVYAFGGYGLFTFKNILTYFDNTNKEWFELMAKSKPSERRSQCYQIISDDLFIFGGNISYGSSVIFHDDCWKYNFKKNNWIKLGSLNREYNNAALKSPSVKDNIPFEVSILLPDIWIINCSKNKIDHYKSYNFQYIYDAFFDVTKKYLLTKNKKQNILYVSVLPSSKMLYNKIESFPFYIAQTSFSFLLFILILSILIGILIVIYFKNRKKKISRLESKSQLKLIENQLFIGDRNINSDLTLLEFRILKTFIELNPQPIHIVSLNELFEDETTSLAAQKKRRETTLKSLREKLAFFLNTSQEQVFLESRDLTDKRIKKFVINQDIIAD
ncbi:MAG: hypothetical protein KA521_09050 [Crocinitomicaceae bacterium]|nr:hypothetical protein [Crocinitomicaceae bacterium]